MSPNVELTRQIKAKARELGFDLVGVCPAIEPAGFARFCEWLDCGYAGEMSYLWKRKEAYRHPQSVMEGVRSIVMLGMRYFNTQRITAQPGTGLVAKYAWGDVDYHDLIHQRLKQLKRFTEEQEVANVRGVVDTAPLLEREFAQLAGLGWVGKHTLLINKEQGSWFFLAALLVDEELDDDEPFKEDHCGTCTACIDVCPTDAIVEPYVLDGSRCISYLTIELRDEVPNEFRQGMGDWLFGCDLCQDVCPWNGRAPQSREAGFVPKDDSNPMDLPQLFYLTDDEFRQRFRKTPLWRPKRRGILRNAAIVLGNQRHQPAVPALTHGLEDEETLVRDACHWALEQMDSAN